MNSDEEWTPMDRTTADSLLRGDRTGLPLDRVLAAAKGPASARELAGEDAAVAAFRAATAAPARRFPVVRSVLTKLLTVKVAAAAFATTATVGGVALAANTGAMPGPVSAPAAPVSASTSPQPKPSPSASPSRPRPTGSPSARPDRVTDLCREFSRRGRDDQRRALDDERFGDLVRRAGEKDRDRVERYCGVRPSGSASTRPAWNDDYDNDNDNDSGYDRPTSRPRHSGSMTPRRE